MKLFDLRPAKGSKHRRKIVGRGQGSGHGGSATRGMKGQNSRSGRGTRPGFEGGQMPILRRIPKKGFTNIFRKEYSVINVGTLDSIFDVNSEINREVLVSKGLLKGNNPIKILGTGKLEKSFKITADKFSQSAAEKIKKSGGEAIILKKEIAK
ncbi:MAG: 50S ribosomal protein L15 [Elusimicrobia bacterium ADurb.Bin231]|nr:MAG: 50S ribosomal protein L15 [Elusimicrobia bacterium ADurb.Bin231]